MASDLPEEVERDYEVERELGVGGQGRTYLARRRTDGEPVVVKMLDFVLLSSWKDLELMQREIAVLRSLDHPAIPHLYAHYPEDLDSAAPDAFVVIQEYVPGSTLRELLDAEGGPLFGEEEAREFLGQMLGILEYLHGFNPPVVHRDIKPSNLIRRDDGTYALIDFGAARATSATGSSTFVGTNGYMAPEQLMGRAEPRSDLFALGATTLELLTGIEPSNLSLEDLSFRLDLLDESASLVDMLRVLTHSDPKRRYQSASRARAALDDPGDAMILGVETSGRLEAERFADGTISVQLPGRKRSEVVPATLLGLAAMVFTVVIGVAGGLLSGVLTAVIAVPIGSLCVWWYGRRPALELDDEEVRIRYRFGPFSRARRWPLDDLVDASTLQGVPGVMLQVRNGAQRTIREKGLRFDEQAWLAQLIHTHLAGRR